MGFPKFKGGLGGYARFIAICPHLTGATAYLSVKSRKALYPKHQSRCTGMKCAECG